jgi:hypothetical protein
VNESSSNIWKHKLKWNLDEKATISERRNNRRQQDKKNSRWNRTRSGRLKTDAETTGVHRKQKSES